MAITLFSEAASEVAFRYICIFIQRLSRGGMNAFTLQLELHK